MSLGDGSGLSAADIMALAGNNDGFGNGAGFGWWIILFILLLGGGFWGGRGWGGNGGGNDISTMAVPYMYNAGVQQMNQDMLLWNDVSDMQMEIIFAQGSEDTNTVEKVCYQLLYKLDENLSERMAAEIGWNYYLSEEDYADPTTTVLAWMETDAAFTSPFFSEDYVNGYFETAKYPMQTATHSVSLQLFTALFFSF